MYLNIQNVKFTLNKINKKTLAIFRCKKLYLNIQNVETVYYFMKKLLRFQLIVQSE